MAHVDRVPRLEHCDDNVNQQAPDNSSIICGKLRSQVWLIGGTTEGLALARHIVKAELPCTVTVTTETAQLRYPQAPSLQRQVRRFDRQTLAQFCAEENIAVVLDASHPHATEISTLAMETADLLGIPYLRFERDSVSAAHSLVQEVKDIEAVLTDRFLLGQRVLLTLGAKTLHYFQPWQTRSTLFARILPSQTALQAAQSAGFPSERLIALRPPISVDLEIALWKQWQIERVVTKASGQPGGEGTKRQAAAALDIPLVVIQRPQLAYPRQTSEIEDAIAFCRRILEQRHPGSSVR